MKKALYFLIFLLFYTLFSCEKPDLSSLPSMKIYDDKNGNKSFHPLSIAKSPTSEGYLVLSAFDGWRIQLMKIDNNGEFEWNVELPNNYINASPELIVMQNEAYLVCMDQIGLFTRLLKIDELNKAVMEVSSFESILYPVYAHYTGQHLMILNCPLSSQVMGVHQVSSTLDTTDQRTYLNINANVEDYVLKHAMHTGKRWPIFIKATPDQQNYIVNGFYNYSFSTVFLGSDLSFQGVYNGPGFGVGISALLPFGIGDFAVARQLNQNVFYNSKAPLMPTNIAMASSIEAQGNAELDTESPTLIKNLTIKGEVYRAFLSSTRSQQLLLSLYDQNGELKGTKYIGKSVPIKACDMIQTPYSELLILAQVRIMGSYNRISTIKLSKSNLEAMLEDGK